MVVVVLAGRVAGELFDELLEQAPAKVANTMVAAMSDLDLRMAAILAWPLRRGPTHRIDNASVAAIGQNDHVPNLNLELMLTDLETLVNIESPSRDVKALAVSAAAVASAFKTPEVIRAFAAREPAALRGRLAALNEDARLGRMTAAAAKTAAIEIILALKKLGEVLTPDEAAALASASAAQRAGFEAADRAIAEASVMSMTRA